MQPPQIFPDRSVSFVIAPQWLSVHYRDSTTTAVP